MGSLRRLLALLLCALSPRPGGASYPSSTSRAHSAQGSLPSRRTVPRKPRPHRIYESPPRHPSETTRRRPRRFPVVETPAPMPATTEILPRSTYEQSPFAAQYLGPTPEPPAPIVRKPVPRRLPKPVPNPAPNPDGGTSSTPPSTVLFRPPPSRPRPATATDPERLDNRTLVEVLDAFDRALSHTPYAVCGLAALAVWGLDSRQPSHVSVLCPAYSRDVIKCWAASHGMTLYASRPDVIGVPASDGRPRRVQLKYLPDGSGFGDLRVVRAGAAALTSSSSSSNSSGSSWQPPPYSGPMGTTLATAAKVLDLASLLDLMAQQYMRPRNREVRGRRESERLAASRSALAQDIYWILFRIIDGGFVEDGAAPLTASQVPHVVDSRFWNPFVAAYPDAVEVFATAGLVRAESS